MKENKAEEKEILQLLNEPAASYTTAKSKKRSRKAPACQEVAGDTHACGTKHDKQKYGLPDELARWVGILPPRSDEERERDKEEYLMAKYGR